MEAFKVWFYSGLTLFSIASIYISEFHFKQLNLEIRKQILLQIFANIFGENVTFPSLFIILCENFWKYFQTQEKRNFFEVLPPCVEGLYSMSRQVGRLEGLRGGGGGDWDRLAAAWVRCHSEHRAESEPVSAGDSRKPRSRQSCGKDTGQAV